MELLSSRQRGAGWTQREKSVCLYFMADVRIVFVSENYLRIQFESRFLVVRMLFSVPFFVPLELSR